MMCGLCPQEIGQSAVMQHSMDFGEDCAIEVLCNTIIFGRVVDGKAGTEPSRGSPLFEPEVVGRR